MWPHVVIVASGSLAVAGIDNIAVVHQSVAVVVKLAEVHVGVVLFGQQACLFHHRAWVLVAARVVVGGIVGCFVCQVVGSHHVEVGHVGSHGVVGVVVFHASCAPVLAVAHLVEPCVEVLVLKFEGAVGKVHQHHQILALVAVAQFGCLHLAAHKVLVEQCGRLFWLFAMPSYVVSLYGACRLQRCRYAFFLCASLLQVMCALRGDGLLARVEIIVHVAEESLLVFCQHIAVERTGVVGGFIAMYSHHQRGAIGLHHLYRVWVGLDGCCLLHRGDAYQQCQGELFHTSHFFLLF